MKQRYSNSNLGSITGNADSLFRIKVGEHQVCGEVVFEALKRCLLLGISLPWRVFSSQTREWLGLF